MMIRQIIKILCLSFILSVYSESLFCSNANKGNLSDISPIKKLSFDVGYWVNPRLSGHFYDKDSSLIFFFADPVSHKEIQFFNKEQQLIKRLPLNNIRNIDLCRTIEIPCWDSVILTFGNPLQLICIIDSAGQKVYTKYFFKQTIKDNVIYEYQTSFQPVCSYYNGCMILRNVVVFHYNDTQKILNDFSKDYSNKLFCKLDLTNGDSDSFATYYSEIYTASDIWHSENLSYKIVNDKLIHLIDYNSKLVVTDMTDVDNYKIIDIKSKFTSIGRKQTHLNKKDNVQKVLQDYMTKLTGRILNVLWDKYRQKYYVMISSSQKHKNKYSDIILQVLDKDLGFEKEIKINNSDGRYSFFDAGIIKEGLLLNCNPWGKDDNIRKKSNDYELYSVDF